MRAMLFGGPYRPKGPQPANPMRWVRNRNIYNKEGGSKFARYLIQHPATPGTRVISMDRQPYVVGKTGALLRLKVEATDV